MRAELAVFILTAVVALLAGLSLAQHDDNRSGLPLVTASTGGKAPSVRLECTMGPPQIQKSDARRIA